MCSEQPAKQQQPATQGKAFRTVYLLSSRGYTLLVPPEGGFPARSPRGRLSASWFPHGNFPRAGTPWCAFCTGTPFLNAGPPYVFPSKVRWRVYIVRSVGVWVCEGLELLQEVIVY